jgi:tetratricopeptide (TPR) repeat protein
MKRLAIALSLVAALSLLAGCGADPAFTAGKVYLGQKDYGKAVEQLKTAIRNSPNDYRPPMYLGMAYADTDKLPEAHDQFFKALELATDESAKKLVEDTIKFYWLKYEKQGEQYNAAAKYEQAIPEFEKAIVIDPRKVSGHANLGVALHMSGQPDAAVVEFEKALEYAPDDSVIVGNLVSTYQTKAGSLATVGDDEGALTYYRKIEAIAPETPNLFYDMASRYYEMKNYTQAISYYQRELALAPDDQEVLYKIFLCHWALAGELKEGGQTDLASDQFRACLESLTKLVELDDTNVTYHRGLMRVYNELGQENEALVELRKIEELLTGTTPQQ